MKEKQIKISKRLTGHALFYWFMGLNYDDSTKLDDYTLRTDSLYYVGG
jgi:hypothetical protein